MSMEKLREILTNPRGKLMPMNLTNMTKEEFLKDLESTFKICHSISVKKNADYSVNTDPFSNFRMSTQVGVDPARAILVRISDKISRISNLLDKEASVKDESIGDSIMDSINYLAILKAFLKDNYDKQETWSGIDKEKQIGICKKWIGEDWRFIKSGLKKTASWENTGSCCTN